MSDIRIPASVTIREPVDSRSWKATLPNGKEIIAFESKVRKISLPRIQPGTRCTVHLSLCDFDHGKIVGVEAPAPIAS
jgi:hypothetical protein